MIIAGVEEAGRGPVIGPMVMAICSIDKKNEEKLAFIGVKDSKLLTPKRREELFEQVKKLCEHTIIVLEPQDIDDSLNSSNMNLNKLEGVTSAKLINSLKLDQVILDCPSNNILAYTSFVKEKVTDKNVKIIAEHKADLNHLIVGAASILAKVTRDRLIEELKQKIGMNFGSGYPADPITISFLNKYWKKHEIIFRKTWKTYKKVEEAQNQKGLRDF